MSRKRHSGDQIIGKLRQADVELGQGRDRRGSRPGRGNHRDELLNGELFLGLADARWVIDRWRLDYNHRRRHSALDYQAPATFAGNCVLEDSATLYPPEHRTSTDLKLSHSEWYKIWVQASYRTTNRHASSSGP